MKLLVRGLPLLLVSWDVRQEPLHLRDELVQCVEVALREALLGRGRNPVTPEQGASVMAILEAAFKSHEEGRAVAPKVSKEERGAW